MRAAPAEAMAAPGSIARISQRVLTSAQLISFDISVESATVALKTPL